MTHLGDICKIGGAEADPVDVIIGGSPCQDLSVAGKRAGLDGERSGLFMEQIRIIKEMRNATNGIRPRYMVWENVPGAFSSNKGEDFRVVLEETAKIADEAAVIPRPDKGEWTNAGAIMGDGWSIAWRVLDAQFWGVPQRRRRIALVADFGGQSAPEILFERKGVSGDIAESGAKGERVAGDVEAGVGETECYPINTQIITRHNALGERTGFGLGKNGDPAFTIQAGHEHGVAVLFEPKSALEENWAESNVKNALRARESKSSHAVFDARGNGDGKKQYVFENHSQDTRYVGPLDVAPIVSATFGMGGNNQPFVVKELDTYSFQRSDELKESQVSSTQSARQYKSPTDLVAAVDCRNLNETGETFGTLQAKPNGGQSLNYSGAVRSAQSVRRLTPLEAERLQGFPDNWTNIPPQTEVTEEDLTFWRTVWDEWQTMNEKKLKTDKQIIKWLQSEPADSARYKALGNSIALPPWRFVLSRIHKQGARTMASLFDGIGGFPKIWDELGGQTLWASEVDPFPIAVTRCHFKEDKP